jgi:hypothetical protein
MKKCTICKADKDPSEFNKNKGKKDGLNNICRACSRSKSKNYYLKKGVYHKNQVVKRNKKYREQLKEFFLNYLRNSSCKDCGVKDIRVLEFDHLPEYVKKNNVSTMYKRNYSIKTILDELRKCDVVCANCHRIRTAERNPKHYRNASIV